jgi:hypothetical protein
MRIFSSRRLKGSGNATEAIALPTINVVLRVSALTRMKNCSRASDLKLVYVFSAADPPRCLTHEHGASAPYRESIRTAMSEPFYG